MKKILTFFLLILFVTMLVGCKKEELKITGPNTLESGTSIKLKVNYDGSDEVVWSSFNDEIATVVDGVVIGKKKGTTIINVTVGNQSASKKITVTYPVVEISIEGASNLYVGDEYKFSYHLSKEVKESVIWSTSDENIITVDEEGKVNAKGEGIAFVEASIYDKKTQFKVTVTEKIDYVINITGPNKVNVDDEFKLNISTNVEGILIYELSNEEVATIDEDGTVVGKKIGTTTIKVFSKDDDKIYSTFEIEVINVIPTKITLKGSNNIVSGEHSFIEVEVSGNVTNEVIWTSSNDVVATCENGIVLGLTPGKATITATSVVDENTKGTLEVTVSKYVASKPSEENLKRVNAILNKMTLSQKIGQMFIVGFNGTKVPSNLSNAIEDYNFGNVIYMAYNVTNPATLTSLSNTIQNKMVSSNTVPGFISIDQEGGRVVRLTNGGTHFISQMAMGATGNYNNTYLEGNAVGKELISYGINMDLTPVLDVNNNPNNPIIGIRSYSDNPIFVSLYGDNMVKGLKSANVVACSKHFPGHGNTAVDSHYGLPMITSSKEDLYKIELAPFISSIEAGIDAIMTTHIIFTEIDSTYPATLSKKVLTNLLREELGYDGLIVTDGMGMAAITKYFGTADVTSVMAVKAGVDILTYTSINDPITAHGALMNAVKTGEISEERINESVRRILLTKLEYGILDSYIKEDIDRTKMLDEHDKLNLEFAMNSLTLAKGEFKGLDKSKSTLIISPTTTHSLGNDLENNSFACFATNYLKANGHTNCEYKVVANNVSSTDSKNILNSASNYDQIVVALSNVKTSNYSSSVELVKELIKIHNNVIVIALDTPYDLIAYGQGVNTYICVYGYQKATVVALSKYLNGEFESKGISPIDESNYK